MHVVLKMAATSGTTHALGEVVAQVGTRSPFDLGKIVRFACVGLLLHGPLSYLWLTGADLAMERVGRRWSRAARTLSLIVADQIAWGPFWILVSCAVLRQLEGRPLDGLLPMVGALCVRGWGLWLPAHTVTYGAIKGKLARLIWVDSVEICWVCILACALRGTPH
mmetsp:Transcript_13542/g.45883  ORF Transcript_13542/g.45883 Transcript_13542/m.45883 type:complete len:165 (+) Transcript_13542:34-528(+)